LNQPVPAGAANTIIEAYLQTLEQEGSHALVAMYAACLRQGNGEESYAKFLKSQLTGPFRLFDPADIQPWIQTQPGKQGWKRYKEQSSTTWMW
jgi:hypothetical protein